MKLNSLTAIVKSADAAFDGIHAPKNKKEYAALKELFNTLFDEYGANSEESLLPVMDFVLKQMNIYAKVPQPEGATPAEVLAQLMGAQGLKQADLADICGGQSRVSEILAGKLEPSLEQAKALGEYFGVSATVFLDI